MSRLICSPAPSPKPSGLITTQVYHPNLSSPVTKISWVKLQKVKASCFKVPFISLAKLTFLITRRLHSFSTCSLEKPSDGLLLCGSKAVGPFPPMNALWNCFTESSTTLWRITACCEKGKTVHGQICTWVLHASSTKLACQDDKMSLNTLIHLTICLDHLLKNRQALWGTANQVPTTGPPEPMKLRWSKLSLTECEKQKKAGLCFYCSINNHFVAQCPNHLQKSESLP